MGSSLAIASGGYSAEVCRLLVTAASLVTELGLQARGLQQLRPALAQLFQGL